MNKKLVAMVMLSLMVSGQVYGCRPIPLDVDGVLGSVKKESHGNDGHWVFHPSCGHISFEPWEWVSDEKRPVSPETIRQLVTIKQVVDEGASGLKDIQKKDGSCGVGSCYSSGGNHMDFDRCCEPQTEVVALLDREECV